MLARGGICAQEQGPFWQFVGAIFASDGSRSHDRTIEAAGELGLDIERFSTCLDATSTAAMLADDIALADAAGVRATPTILVNGLAFEGAMRPDQLRAILDDTRPCGCERRSANDTCGESGEN